MAKRRKEAGPTDAARRDRINQAIDLLYQGNQVTAARVLGVSQPQISRILSGTRPPTDSFIEALASQPGLNPLWLHGGVGEPLTSGTLPVSRMILPGPPEEHVDLCSGERHPVAAVLDRRTRYWLELEAHSVLVQRLALLFLAKDRLLIETARDHLDRVDVLDGQLCAVTARSKTQLGYEMTQVFSKGGELVVKLYDDMAGTDSTEKEQPKRATIFDVAVQPGPRKCSKLKKPTAEGGHLGQPEPGPAHTIEKSTIPPGWRSLAGPHEVIGLALKLERTSPLFPETL